MHNWTCRYVMINHQFDSADNCRYRQGVADSFTCLPLTQQVVTLSWWKFILHQSQTKNSNRHNLNCNKHTLIVLFSIPIIITHIPSRWKTSILLKYYSFLYSNTTHIWYSNTTLSVLLLRDRVYTTKTFGTVKIWKLVSELKPMIIIWYRLCSSCTITTISLRWLTKSPCKLCFETST